MSEANVLVNYENGCEILGVFTDKSVLEEYLACPCEADCECGESSGTHGNESRYHELDSWTVALDDPRFVSQPEDSRENSGSTKVHVLSNGFGEILGVYTDKSLLEESLAYPPEDKCEYCEYCESRGEVCPYRQSFIDSVILDDPGLIQQWKERIAQFRAEIRGTNKLVR